MKILFLINHAGKGGSEKYVQILAEYLKDKEDIFFIYNEEGPLVDKMKELGANVSSLEMKSPFDFTAAKKLSQYCKDNEIDIVHTQFPRENYIALLAKRKIEKLKIIHTSHLILEQNFIWKFTNGILAKNNDLVISVCNKNKECMIKNKYPEDKIQVIFNGVVYKNYVHNITNSTFRRDFNILPTEFVFVCVSRMTEEKGLPFLIDSVKLLTSLVDIPFKVILVGDGQQEEMLKEKIELLEIDKFVIFAGYREDVDNILMGSNCFINSSKSEALSFAILEALSKALPVIATKVGGNTDILTDDYPCGILVRYGSTVQMAKAMEKMMTNSDFYKLCSENTTINIKERFDIDKICAQTYDAYKKIYGED